MHVLDCFTTLSSLISAVMVGVPLSSPTGPLQEFRMFPSLSQRIDLSYFGVNPGSKL